jgi:FkbM family methyltransferase
MALVLAASVCFSDTQYHEFEGISEAYNIRNLRVLAQLLPENPVIIEAGAYKGRDTLKLAQKFPAGRIYAFEPLRTAFPHLCEAMRPFSNVAVINQALDVTAGKKDFYICYGTWGQNPIFEFHSSLLKPFGVFAINLIGPTEKVSCTTLFDFCQENNIEKIDMLWLSTEGSESQILAGSQELLDQVSLVFVHTQLHCTRESMVLFHDLKTYMERNGFILLSHFYIPGAHGDALFINAKKFIKR